MNKNRIESFSDGVIAIIITIMILEIRLPENANLEALEKVIPVLISYILSFIFVGIYWVNHHHMFQAISKVNGKIMWANLHLLFWLSLIPFGTNWIGVQKFESIPMAFYGFLLLMCAISFQYLQSKMMQFEGSFSVLREVVKEDKKGKISLICYICAIPLAFVSTYISGILYIIVALIWVVPDKNIERKLQKQGV